MTAGIRTKPEPAMTAGDRFRASSGPAGLVITCALALGLGFVPAAAQAPAPAPPNESRHLRLAVVASGSAMTNINQNDAKAAVKVWLDIIARQKGYVLDSSVDIAGNVREIRNRLESHSTELIVLTTSDYLEMESSHLMTPVLTHALLSQGGAAYSYLFLVGPSSQAATLADLRGRSILTSTRGGSNIAGVWLDVLLGRENLGRATSFFSSVRSPEKAQDCILSLFFGKEDACVVDEVSLNMAKELNPQLGKLKVLARSRPMIGSVIATPVEPFPGRTELIDALLSLHEDPRGRQVLHLFRSERVLRIQSGDIDSVRDLFAESRRLPAAHTAPASTRPLTIANTEGAGK